jgi:hypothetical protein
MNQLSRRTRIRPSIGAESLESRHLLNAHVPHQPAVHVAAAPKAPKPHHEISGTLTGVSPFTLNPNNSNQGYDTYSATAPTKNGVAQYFGTDAFTSTPVSATQDHDTYFNGSTVLYLAGNNDISISYVGVGTYPLSGSGPYTETFKGEAIGITGSLEGHEYSFNANLTGNADTDAVKIKFTLKD